jgi:small subunit ribosomal protein S13
MDSKIVKPKSVQFELQKVFGLGPRRSRIFCRLLNITASLKVEALDKSELSLLALTFSKATPLNLFKDSLRRKQAGILKKTMKLNSLKSGRLRRGLPVRGQRTHTNAQTSRLRLKNN